MRRLRWKWFQCARWLRQWLRACANSPSYDDLEQTPTEHGGALQEWRDLICSTTSFPWPYETPPAHRGNTFGQ
jgi:hypothetical protein